MKNDLLEALYMFACLGILSGLWYGLKWLIYGQATRWKSIAKVFLWCLFGFIVAAWNSPLGVIMILLGLVWFVGMLFTWLIEWIGNQKDAYAFRKWQKANPIPDPGCFDYNGKMRAHEKAFRYWLSKQYPINYFIR